ncbi:MAG: FG-GAP repeat protein [Alphaproteobacteria bacterium]|nr:FG-GAP repeat protein [Alphaproteobacteria bacterium]
MWWWSIAVAAPGTFVEEEAQRLWVAEGGPGSQFGWAVADIEDLDGDGVRDVITSAPYAAATGFVVALSGVDGRELWRTASGELHAEGGYAIAAAGDLDGDGVWDVVVGEPGIDRVVLMSGVDGSELAAVEGVADERLGSAVGRVGDVDGDGVDDLLVGAESADGGGTDAGRVVLLSGRTRAVLWTVEGAMAGGQLGGGAGHLGDVTGDGVPDVVVGAHGNGGRVLVLDGADGSLVREHVDPDGGGVLGQFFVSGVGDLDGDGVPDVFGGDYANPAKGPGTGRAFVWSGATGATLHTFTGESAGEGLGTGRYAGDVDGDGVPDLAIGSWQHSGGAPGAGRFTLFSGADGSVLRTVTGTREGENLGFDVVGVGDVDGDGAIDLAVSAATGSRVYLVTGLPVPEAPPSEPAPSSGGCGCAHGGGASWLGVGIALLTRRRRLRR